MQAPWSQTGARVPPSRPNRRGPTLWLWTAMLSMAPAAFGTDVDDAALSPGDRFRDCPDCPEMVVVPAGEFMMGSPEDEEGQHKVRIAKPFAVGVYEVTRDEWDATMAGVDYDDPPGWGWDWPRGALPMIHATRADAGSFVYWLSEKTGKDYRLLSESEWEYVARAGTVTPFHFGRTISTSQANFTDLEQADAVGDVVQVGRYPANDFGLHDVHGNVMEWVADCWELQL